jgi:hypothetical protein
MGDLPFPPALSPSRKLLYSGQSTKASSQDPKEKEGYEEGWGLVQVIALHMLPGCQLLLCAPLHCLVS